MNVEMNENAKRYKKKSLLFFFSFLNLFVCYSVKEVWKVLDTKVLGNTFLLLEILSLSTSAAVKSESRGYNFEISSDLVPLNLLRNLESILTNLELCRKTCNTFVLLFFSRAFLVLHVPSTMPTDQSLTY